MLTKREHDALVRWYSQPTILDETKRLAQTKDWEQLDEHLTMRCLLGLSRHSELPEFLRNDDGGPLFPTSLNPAKDLEKWRDAVEVAWEVAEKELGLTQDAVHRSIAEAEQADWEAFLKRAEERRK